MAIIDYNGVKSFEGCVLRTWEHNGYNDSDFYAECINPETGKHEIIEYATTRYGMHGFAEVDITAENYAKYLHNGGKQRELKAFIESEVYHAKQVTKGKEVVVVKGRKVAHGTVGTVFWTKEVNYDPYKRSWNKEIRIGIKDSDGNVYWTYEKNVQVVDYKKYIDMKALRKAVKRVHSKTYLKYLNAK